MLTRSFLIFFAASLCAFGEDGTDTQPGVRFIPQGDSLDPLKDGKGFKPLFRPPKPNSYEIPPNPVVIADSVKLRKEISLLLNQISEPVSLEPGTEALKFWEKKDLVEGPLIKGSLKGSHRYLGILSLDQVEDTWERPELKFLPDDAKSFPVGKIRFVNTTEQIVIIRLGELKPFGIAPGAVRQKSMEGGKSRLMIAFQSSDQPVKTIWQNEIKLGEKERLQCFFYKSRSESSGEVKFLHFRETVPDSKEASK